MDIAFGSSRSRTKVENCAGQYTFVWRKSVKKHLEHDPDATFMRLKEDHIRNEQLKPAYNVQIAVNSEYITGIELFSDRSDVKTLRPFGQV